MVGKTLGTDLACGKFTLPVLLLLQRSNPAQREELRTMLLADGGMDPVHLLDLVRSRGALGAAIAAGRSLVDEAEAALSVVQENRHAQALRSMTEYLRGVFASLDTGN